MVKLERSLKNLELHINVQKNQAIPRFSAANGEFRGTVKIHIPQNTAGRVHVPC